MTDTAVESAPQETVPAKTAPAQPAPETLPEALGARRIAGLMAERMGLAVTADDVERLIADKALKAVDSYKGWPRRCGTEACAPRLEFWSARPEQDDHRAVVAVPLAVLGGTDQRVHEPLTGNTTAAYTRSPWRCTSAPSAHGGSVPGL